MTECKMASSASWKRKHGGDQNNTSSQLVPPPDPLVCQRQTGMYVGVCVWDSRSTFTDKHISQT